MHKELSTAKIGIAPQSKPNLVYEEPSAMTYRDCGTNGNVHKRACDIWDPVAYRVCYTRGMVHNGLVTSLLDPVTYWVCYIKDVVHNGLVT